MQTIQIERPHNHSRQYFCRSMNKSFRVESKNEVAEMNIYDEIGYFGVSAAQFRKELDSLKDAKSINLKINSPGGDVFDGIAIFNDLLSHPAKINVKVTGLAASAASIIAMAGDTVEIADNGFIMIHNAWAVAMGDKNVMNDLADRLDLIDEALSRTYADRTGNTLRNIKQWMNDEKWFNAKEAKEYGFVTQISDAEKMNALFDLSVYNHVPALLKRQIEAGLCDAGLSKREAKAAVKEGFPQREVVPANHRDDEESLTIKFLSSF